MIHFFRKLRKGYFTGSRAGSYLKYAIGEIILVVIGILIALQINEWSAKRAEERLLQDYYVKIQDEVNVSLDYLKLYAKEYEVLIRDNKRSLALLNANNADSLPKLRNTLNAICTAYTATPDLPIIEEFLDQKLLRKIDNDSIKASFQHILFQRKMTARIEHFVDDDYNSNITPFIIKEFNYAEISNGAGDLGVKRVPLIEGGPQTDFNTLKDNVALWNIINLKLETTVLQQIYNNKFIEALEKLNHFLEEEITKKAPE